MADMIYDIDVSDLVRARKEISRWKRSNTDAIDIVNQRMLRMGKTSEFSFNQLGTAATRAQQKSKRFAAVGLQQVGYQVGDFAVQVQSGTNALVAFGQQGSQLAGIAGPGGAIAGMFIAIGTAIATAVLAAKDGAKQFEQAFKDLFGKVETSLKLFDDHIKMAQELEKEVRSLDYAIANLSFSAANLNLKEALESGLEGVDSWTFWENVFKGIPEGIPGLADLVKSPADIVAGFDLPGLSVKVFDDFQEAIDGLDFESAQSQVDELIKLIEAMNGSLGEAPMKLQGLVYQMQMAIQNGELAKQQADNITWALDQGGIEALELADEIGKAAVEALVLSGIDITSPISKAAKEAAVLAANLGKSVQAVALMRAGQVELADQKALYGGGQTAMFDTMRELPFMNKEELDKLFGKNSGSSGGGGGGGSSKTAADYISQLEQEVALKKSLIGLSEDQKIEAERRAEIEKQLMNLQGTVSQERINALLAEEEAVRKLIEAEEDRMAMIDKFEGIISSGLEDMITGAKTVSEAFRDMIRDILLEVYRQQVIQPIASTVSGFLGNIFSADGGGFTGAGPRIGGMDGKGGFLAMLHPNETVVDHTKAGASAGGDSIVVTQNLNVSSSANNRDMVRAEIMALMPRISEAAKMAIMDSRQRGGQFGRLF